MNKKFPSEIINYCSTTLAKLTCLLNTLINFEISISTNRIFLRIQYFPWQNFLQISWSLSGVLLLYSHQDFNKFWQIWKKLCWAISILQSSSLCLSSFRPTIRQLSLQVEIPKCSNNTNDFNSSFYIFCFCPHYYDCTQQPPPQQQQQRHCTSFSSSVQSDVQACIL